MARDQHGVRLIVEGTLDGRAVSATWADGTVTGDAAVLVAAREIIAAGVESTSGQHAIRASYATLGSAVVALCRSVDVLDSVRVSLPEGEVVGTSDLDDRLVTIRIR